jgi:hypothetical protein
MSANLSVQCREHHFALTQTLSRSQGEGFFIPWPERIATGTERGQQAGGPKKAFSPGGRRFG